MPVLLADNVPSVIDDFVDVNSAVTSQYTFTMLFPPLGSIVEPIPLKAPAVVFADPTDTPKPTDPPPPVPEFDAIKYFAELPYFVSMKAI